MHRQKMKTVVIFLAFIMLIFHIKYSIFNEPHFEKTKADKLKEEIKADYDYMWKILEEEYIFFPILEEKGINIETLRKEGTWKIENDVDTLDEFSGLLKQ